MNIVYFTIRNNSRRDGVINKIEQQVACWRSFGHSVKIVSISCRGEDSVLDGDNFHWHQDIPKIRYLLPVRAAINHIKKLRPDIVYMRYFVWNITSFIILKKFPTILEINSDDRAELRLAWKNKKSMRSFILMVGNLLLRGLVLRASSGLCSVTYELADSLPPSVKKVVLPNTLDTGRYTQVLERKPGKIGLFFMGTPGQPWHGVDRMIRIVEELGSGFFLNIVGITGECSSQITYHGYLTREQYLEVLRNSHVCVGTMAIERNGMTEACPLKTREYLAFGYPVIIGYVDSAQAIMASANVLKINWPNYNIDYVRQFCLEHSTGAVKEQALLDSIDNRESEKHRLAFFQEITNRYSF